jgi:pimeloyl-ACP methyl ester carboxylesterase
MPAFPGFSPFSSTLLLASEPYRAMMDYIAGHVSSLTSLPQGDGHPVLVFPGLGVSGSATTELRFRLQSLGYAVFDWEQGVNMVPGASFNVGLALLERQLLELAKQHGQSISLLGWSLGGIYSRELAKKHPTLVRQVVTLATPFADEAASLHARWLRLGLTGPTIEAEAQLLQNLRVHPPVPSASIYSRMDGVVAWQSCIGEGSPLHVNIEVDDVSHFGMVHHPEVLHVLAHLLARPA